MSTRRRNPRKAGGTRTDAERRRLSKASKMRDRPTESDLPVLWCDGGSRGNPGPAAIGFLLVDDGVVLVEGAHPIGVATAALAEYRAVLAGLTAAIHARVDSLEVRTDSRLLVAHMRGEAPVRSEQIALLADEIRSLSPRFALLRYRWVPEAENGAAHRLAQLALLPAAAPPFEAIRKPSHAALEGNAEPPPAGGRHPPVGGAPQRRRTPTTADRASFCASS